MPTAPPRHNSVNGIPHHSSPRDDGFYSRARWRHLRAWYLARHPLCVQCAVLGETTLATEVHHLEARRGRQDLAMAEANLMSLCKPCHSRETRAAGRVAAQRSQSTMIAIPRGGGNPPGAGPYKASLPAFEKRIDIKHNGSHG